ncbi:unnamed protein product [Bathycoccus prasinos]
MDRNLLKEKAKTAKKSNKKLVKRLEKINGRQLDQVVSGLHEEIADFYGSQLGNLEIKRFSDGEMQPVIEESVRGAYVFFIQSTIPPSENVMELLLSIDAAKRASAGHITAVIPYFGYARQDRKDKPRVPISAKLLANLIQASGANRIMTMDLHADQIQGFFDIPVDHLKSEAIYIPFLESKDLSNVTFASPDANEVAGMTVIGDVKGAEVILVDDMVDTAGTLCRAAQALIDAGANSSYDMHPVTDSLTHIDFIELVDGTPVKVDIPIRFKGDSPGVKLGGKLLQSIRRVTVKTLPENLVDELFVDISELELGFAVRVRDIEAPDSVQIMNNWSNTCCNSRSIEFSLCLVLFIAYWYENSIPSNSFRVESPQANKDFIAAQLQSQDLSDTDLVVLPETFNTGFSMKAIHLAEPMHGETVQWMTELSNQYDILLAGSIMIREGNNVFNRFIVAGPDTVVASYDKKHLFGLGAEQDLINPGTERVCFTHKGLMINLQICYDLRFPVWMRNTENVDLILLVANWPAARAKAWRSLLVARAIENQCYILGVRELASMAIN